jgi:hypothetical protein
LNQDVTISAPAFDFLLARRQIYGLIGERIKGDNPAWPNGYVQGTFMFMRADAIRATGLLNAADFPLWGATAEWQMRAARKGFQVLPLPTIPGFTHDRPGRHGSAINDILRREPANRDLFVRTPPLVSVVVPCYNYGRFLPDLLASLIGGPSCLGPQPGQDWQAFEIILVDDASTDDSLSIMRRLANNWRGVRVVARSVNGGTPAANNTGIRAAQGRYIAMMGADDMRAPDSLGNLYRAQVANPHSLIYDNIRVLSHGALGDVIPLHDYDFDELTRKNHVPAGIMFPKSAWAEVGGYPEAMKYGREDWAFAVALGLAGYCGVRLDEAGYWYRREEHNRTLTNTTPSWRAKFLGQMQELFPQAYNGVRSMACCGGSRATPKGATPRGAQARGMTLAGAQAGFTPMEYIGGNYGNTVLYGEASGQQYKFSAAKRQFYADTQDVENLLRYVEQGKAVLRVVRVRAVPTALAPTEKEVTSDGVQNEKEETREPEVAPAAEPAKPKRGRKPKVTDASS